MVVSHSLTLSCRYSRTESLGGSLRAGRGREAMEEGRKGFAFVQPQWINYLCNLLRKAIDVGWRGSCSPIFATQERSWAGATKTCDSGKIRAKEIKTRLFPRIHQKQLNKEVAVPLRSQTIASGSCDEGPMAAGWKGAQETLLFLRATKVALVTPKNPRASQGKGSLEEEAPSVVASSVSSVGLEENPLTQSWPCLLYITQISPTPLLICLSSARRTQKAF